MQIEDYSLTLNVFLIETQGYKTFLIHDWDSFPDLCLKDISSFSFTLGKASLFTFSNANGPRSNYSLVLNKPFMNKYYRSHWTVKYYVKRICPNLFKIKNDSSIFS